MDITKLIAQNLSAWMESQPSLDTIKKLSLASHVGFGTIQRVKNGEGNVTVQNLDLIARAFKRQAIDLLRMPDTADKINVSTISIAPEPPPLDELELLAGYRDASPDVREIMLDAARKAIKKQRLSMRKSS